MPEGAQFCAVCGTAVAAGSAQVPRPAEAPVFVMPEDHELKAPVQEEAAYYNPLAPKKEESPAQKGKAPKKKSKFWKIGLPIFGAAVVVAAVGLVFGNAIVGYAIKWFGSDEAYMNYVEEKAMASFAQGVAQTAEDAEENLAMLGDQSVEGELSFTLSNGVATALSELTESDFEWISSATIPYTVIRNGGLEQSKIGISINETSLLMLDMISDANETYISATPLNEAYLKTQKEQSEQADSGKIVLSDGEVRALLMDSGEVYERLLNRYWSIIMGQCHQAEQSQGTLMVGDVEQKCTELTVTIDEETALRIAQSVLEALQTDEDVKGLIRKVEDLLIEKEALSVESDLYDSFQKEIAEMLDDLKEKKETLVNEEELILTTYVDYAHRVMGRALAINGEDLFSLINLRKGKTLAMELMLSKDLLDAKEDIFLQGSGTVKGGVFNGAYTLGPEDEALLELTVEKLNLKRLQEGDGFSGTLRLTPTAEFYRAFSTNTLSVDPSTKGYSLELKLDLGSGNGLVEATLHSIESAEETVAATVTLKTASRQSEKIALPENATEDAQTWWRGADVEPLATAMMAANCPEELVYLLRILAMSYAYQAAYPIL